MGYPAVLAIPVKKLRRWKQLRNLKKMARDNNIVHSEGHLGGFVQSSATPAPSGLDVTNGDPATWTPQLWQWAVEALGVRSVLDVGCGEGPEVMASNPSP